MERHLRHVDKTKILRYPTIRILCVICVWGLTIDELSAVMLCVGPSYLDWNWQKDGEGKCFRHVWMQHLPQRCLVRSQQEPSNWCVLNTPHRATSSDHNSGPSAPMALLPHAQDWIQQVTRGNWREWMLCVGMAVVFGSLVHCYIIYQFLHSTIYVVQYLAWPYMPNMGDHEVVLHHPTCHVLCQEDTWFAAMNRFLATRRVAYRGRYFRVP